VKHVEVILRRKVESLGDIGDLVRVKPGYARNYLLPKGFAYLATPENKRRLEQERARALEAEAREREAALALAAKLDGLSITFQVMAGEEGKLYGSVGAADIVEKLGELGFEIEKRQVGLEEPIRTLGAYSVPIKLHPDVRPEVKVWVIKEEGASPGSA
jgi:large subunit ribosomal protein L9